MRQLYLDSNSDVSDEVLRMLSANSPNGILFPSLRELTWKARSYPLDRLFFSPHLTHFTFLCPSRSNRLSDRLVSNLTSVMLELRTSSLQSLRIDSHVAGGQIPTCLKSAVSSAVLRCGPSLTYLSVPTLLSNVAVQHIMQLPKLAKWVARSGPPRIPDLSVSDAFPQLDTLELHTEASLEWIPFLGANAYRTFSGQGAHTPPNRGHCPKLTTLRCAVGVPLDAAFVSPVMLFRGLAHLVLRSPCSSKGGCAFHLTDEDIAEIATALPNLKEALFGFTCSANSCRTTVSSLLFLSARCKSLRWLETHFNTANLRRDLESMAENPRLRDLYALPRCRLEQLSVSYAPLQIQDEDYEPVIEGFFRIFPSFGGINGIPVGWQKLSAKMWGWEWDPYEGFP